MIEDGARLALERLDPLWEELFPVEPAWIIRLLADRLDIGEGGSVTASAQMQTVRVPLVGRKVMIAPDGMAPRGASAADATLPKALARAFQ
jgi:hypothetical protein